MKFEMCRWAKGWESKIVQFSVSKKEVVFLVDASKSMGGRGDNAIMDSVRQILYSLPSDVQAGLVVYNTGIQDIAEVGSSPEEMERILGVAEKHRGSRSFQGRICTMCQAGDR